MKGNGKGSRMVTFSVSKQLLAEFDAVIEGVYDNRSEALRAKMRETVQTMSGQPMKARV